MDPDKALSLESIRSISKSQPSETMAFEAMWSTIGWMLPLQAIGLLIGGVDVFASIGLAVAMSFGLALASPFAAGIVAAFAEEPMSDRIAWVLMVGLASVIWISAGGALVGAGLAAAAIPLFLVLERRQRQRKAEPPKAEEAHILPGELRARLAALPEELPESVGPKIDRALAAAASLHALREALPDGDSLWTDAIACTERVAERAEAAVRLHGLPQQSPEVEKAKTAVDDRLDALSEQLAAVVDAASRYVALDTDDVVAELSAGAESLHALVEATHEVEDALR